MPSSTSFAFAVLLLASCTAFSGADIDPPSGDAGTAGTTSGSSGYAGSLSPGGAGQGGSAGASSGAAGLAGSGGQAGVPGGAAGVAGAAGDSGGASGGAAGDGGPAGKGGQQPGGGNQAGGPGAGASGGSGAAGSSGQGGSAGGAAGSAGQGGSGGAVCGDGVVQPGEECDDGLGNGTTTGGCLTTCQKSCPPSPGGVAIKSGSTCYFSLGGPVSWEQAKSKCSAYGGKGHYALASLESQAEFNAIKGATTTFGLDGFWIGGRRVSGKLTWLSGQPVSFADGQAPWGKNEPDDSYDCITIDSDFVSSTLATDDCTDEHVPLCEW